MVENAPGMSALDMNTAEDMVVRNTREVVPGMIICGMEVKLHLFCLLLILLCQPCAGKVFSLVSSAYCCGVIISEHGKTVPVPGRILHLAYTDGCTHLVKMVHYSMSLPFQKQTKSWLECFRP